MGAIQQSPEQIAWLKERQGAIGASEAAAVLGLHPWLSPIEVWISKVHPELVAPRDNFLLRHGTYMEPVIARHYEDQTGRKLVQGVRTVHPKYPMIAVSPDRLVVGEPREVELKSCNEFAMDKFGDFGTSDVPEAYLVQAWTQMEVLGVPFCDIAAMLGGARFGVYPIHEDKEVQKSLIDQLREWWDHYVLAKKEPPVDASEGWRDYILARYPSHGAGMLKLDPFEHPEIVEALSGFSKEKAEEEKHKEQKELYKNQVCAFIQNHDGIIIPGSGKVTWKLSKDTVEDQIYWEGIAGHLVASGRLTTDEMAKIIWDYTKKGVVVRQGSRRFLYSEGK